MSWRGIENGELLALIREAGFEAFVTVDQNLAYQQNLRAAGLRIVILVARTNKLQRPSASDSVSPRSSRTPERWRHDSRQHLTGRLPADTTPSSMKWPKPPSLNPAPLPGRCLSCS